MNNYLPRRWRHLHRRAVHTAVLILLVLLSGAAAQANPSNAAAVGDLTVEISGAGSDTGRMAVRLWQGADHWLDRNEDNPGIVHTLHAELQDGRPRVLFRDLPYGEYAITAYHDANDNGKLDTGLFRVPKERLGFSNGLRPKFSAPAYRDAVFTVAAPEATLAIEIRRLP